MEADEPVMGIDLGTTYSRVGVWEQGKVKLIPNTHGLKHTPSCVAFTPEGERLIGVAAQHQITLNPEYTFYQIRRMLGREGKVMDNLRKEMSWPFILGRDGKRKPQLYTAAEPVSGARPSVYPEELAAFLLADLRQMAQRTLGREVTRAVLSVPACYDSVQRQCLLHAARIAGIKVLRLVNDPTATAIAYSFSEHADPSDIKRLLLIDFGGGSCDMSVVAIRRRHVQVLATRGSSKLGGEDIDNTLALKFLVKIDDKLKKNGEKFRFRGNNVSVQRLRIECEKAKRGLASSKHMDVPCDSLFPDGRDDYRQLLSRENVTTYCGHILEQFNTLLREILESANCKPSSVHDVVVAGGSTLLPMVKDSLKATFGGRHINTALNSDTAAVVTGATILAAHLPKPSDDPDTQSLLVEDITPHDVLVFSDIYQKIGPFSNPLSTGSSQVAYIPKHVRLGVSTEIKDALQELQVYEQISLNPRVEVFLGEFKSPNNKKHHIHVVANLYTGITSVATKNSKYIMQHNNDILLSEPLLHQLTQNRLALAQEEEQHMDILKAWEELDKHVYATKQHVQEVKDCLDDHVVAHMMATCKEVISKLEENEKMPLPEIEELRTKLDSVCAERLLSVPRVKRHMSFTSYEIERDDEVTASSATKRSANESGVVSYSDTAGRTCANSTKHLLDVRLSQVEAAVRSHSTTAVSQFSRQLTEILNIQTQNHVDKMTSASQAITALYWSTRHQNVQISAPPFAAEFTNLQQTRESICSIFQRWCMDLDRFADEIQIHVRELNKSGPEGYLNPNIHDIKYINLEIDAFKTWYNGSNEMLGNFLDMWETKFRANPDNNGKTTAAGDLVRHKELSREQIDRMLSFSRHIDRATAERRIHSGHNDFLQWLADLMATHEEEIDGFLSQTEDY